MAWIYWALVDANLGWRFARNPRMAWIHTNGATMAA
jgi:hypothetical protein